MRAVLKSRPLLLVGVVVAASFVVAGFAFGAIPGTGGAIQGCYDSGGNLKVVNALPCPKGFTPLSWAQQGATGQPEQPGQPGQPERQEQQGRRAPPALARPRTSTPTPTSSTPLRQLAAGGGVQRATGRRLRLHNADPDLPLTPRRTVLTTRTSVVGLQSTDRTPARRSSSMSRRTGTPARTCGLPPSLPTPHSSSTASSERATAASSKTMNARRRPRRRDPCRRAEPLAASQGGRAAPRTPALPPNHRGAVSTPVRTSVRDRAGNSRNPIQARDERRNIINAELAARGMGSVSLGDALALVVLYAEGDRPAGLERATVRWPAGCFSSSRCRSTSPPGLRPYSP